MKSTEAGSQSRRNGDAQETNAQIQAALEELRAMERQFGERIRSVSSALRRLLKPLDWDGSFADALKTLRSSFDFDTELELEKIKAMFATPERQEALTHLREPTLLLVPEDAFDVQVRAIDRSKLAPSQTFVNQEVFGKFSRKSEEREKVKGVQPIIIEGSITTMIAPFDDAEKTLGERRTLVRTNRAPGMQGTNRHSYATLMLSSLRKGSPVDPETYTIFDEDEACSETCLPGGFWFVDQASFVWFHPVRPVEVARFRSEVRGDVIA